MTSVRTSAACACAVHLLNVVLCLPDRVEEPGLAQADLVPIRQQGSRLCPPPANSSFICQEEQLEGFQADDQHQPHADRSLLSVKYSGREDHREVWSAIRRGIERLKHQQVGGGRDELMHIIMQDSGRATDLALESLSVWQ